jgi:hypothetical protein
MAAYRIALLRHAVRYNPPAPAVRTADAPATPPGNNPESVNQKMTIFAKIFYL